MEDSALLNSGLMIQDDACVIENSCYDDCESHSKSSSATTSPTTTPPQRSPPTHQPQQNNTHPPTNQQQFHELRQAQTQPSQNQHQEQIAGSISIVDLADDVLGVVFAHCSGTDVLAFEATCRKMRKLIHSDENLWRQKCNTNLPFDLLRITDDTKLLIANNVPCEEAGDVGNQPEAKLTWRQAFVSFSNILVRDRISCTGLNASQKNEQKMICVGLGGSYQGHLDRSVTILVVGQAGTDKYKFARAEHIPMVTQQWVRDCFAQRKRLDPTAYQPPLLVGLRFCATQVQAGLRQMIADQVTQHGGEYTADLRKDFTTHLIAVRPEGRKFEFAHRWRMQVVRPQWLLRVLELQQIVDEQQHTVGVPENHTFQHTQPHHHHQQPQQQQQQQQQP